MYSPNGVKINSPYVQKRLREIKADNEKAKYLDDLEKKRSKSNVKLSRSSGTV